MSDLTDQLIDAAYAKAVNPKTGHTDLESAVAAALVAAARELRSMTHNEPRAALILLRWANEIVNGAE
jgi:hypothetical protein